MVKKKTKKEKAVKKVLKKKVIKKPAVLKKKVKKKTLKKIVKKVKKITSKKVVKKKIVSKKPIKKVKKKTPKKTVKRVKKTTPKKHIVKKEPIDRILDGVHQTKIRVIGVGGGGSTIVSEITSRIKKADFYVANTDVQALQEASKEAKRFPFGQNQTHGLGTGMNVELGEEAALEDKEKIEKLLEGQDLCIIIAALGGGTSSGAAPVFAKISKNLGNLTYGIFTLPFEFEGEKKMESAMEALDKLKSSVNVYTVIPNEKIFQIVDKNTPLKSALSAINERLADSLGGLIEMIYLPGLINIDFADLKTILSGRGRLAYLNTIEIEEIDKEEVVNKLISSPLHPYTIKGARGILYNIVSGTDIQLSEVSRISNIIAESVNKKAKIIFGINQGNKDKGKIKITLLATGCSGKGFLQLTKKITPPKPKKKKKIAPKIEKTVSKPKEVIPVKKVETPPKEVKKEKTTPIPVEKKEEPKKEEPKKVETPKVEKKKEIFVEKPELNKEVSEIPIKVQQKPIETESSESIFPKVDVSRKNALQLRQEAEEKEKEVLEKEKIWEIPAILRRKDQS